MDQISRDFIPGKKSLVMYEPYANLKREVMGFMARNNTRNHSISRGGHVSKAIFHSIPNTQ